MNLEVVKIVKHGSDIRELWLKLPGGGTLPEWEAGAHIRVTLPTDQIDLKRHYSLIGSPDDRMH